MRFPFRAILRLLVLLLPIHAFANPHPVDDEMCQAKRAIEAQAGALLAAGRYSELDALAASFRKSQQSFANGYWSLSLFYQVVAGLKDDASEQDWQQRIGLLRKWFNEDVECITPRVALARGLVGYAWHARGHAWASQVPKEALPLVYERVAEANRILEAARSLPEKCPGWYSAWQQMAMLAGPTHEQYDDTFAEGLRNFPSYRSLYLMKTLYLLERWYGKRGDWQKFAIESCDALGADQGDVLYAQIVWYLHDTRIYGNPIRDGGVDWQRVQHGFQILTQQNPNSLLTLSEYCSISGFAPHEARQLMGSLFAELNDRVDLDVWRTMALYQKDHNWACGFAQQ